MKLNAEQINAALALAGYPPVAEPGKIGEGAWHEVFLVEPEPGVQLVVRLKKAVAYGKVQPYNEAELRAEYAAAGLYYQQANRLLPGICPATFRYHVSEHLTFTLESYLGESSPLGSLSLSDARRHGEQVGAFFRAMHAAPAPLPGFGELIWQDGVLAAQQLAPDWEAERRGAEADLASLQASGLSANWDRLAARLASIRNTRRYEEEPVVLVNQDVTPENLLMRGGRFAGLVDARPMLHNGLRYAAFFVVCYRSLLPALADAPRYARHDFRALAPTLAAIADGFERGHGGDGEHLRMEQFLFVLGAAAENWRRLQRPMTEEVRLRAGSPEAIAARVQRFLIELEQL